MPKTEIDHVKGHNLRVMSSANFAKNVALILWGSAGLGAYLHGWSAKWLVIGYTIGGACCFGLALYLLGNLVKEVEDK
ncbi:hypothetical protein [Paracoccus methylarcula]|uniref:Uncharacterized protein n=1 Tax=Paracoccus methylarcula TaxID=72022 RepID=A0A422QVI8_9RHOB|nr:hypothetical protein [Paracoccus methylarcula]RNF33986.1 hypothetical protein A7A09_013865 [Paracoccus methylarcula]